MEAIEEIMQEHEIIDRELIELETIMDSSNLNIPNLLHVFKKLTAFWGEHERKETRFFPILEKKGVKIPVERLFFEHGTLKQHRDALSRAIDTGSDFKIREALKEHGSNIIGKLRAHMEFEDNILETTPMPELSEKELKKCGF